jgi:hypothetical protein
VRLVVDVVVDGDGDGDVAVAVDETRVRGRCDTPSILAG